MTRCVIYLMMPQGERGGERKTLGLVFLLPVGSMALFWGLQWRMSEPMVHIVPQMTAKSTGGLWASCRVGSIKTFTGRFSLPLSTLSASRLATAAAAQPRLFCASVRLCSNPHQGMRSSARTHRNPCDGIHPCSHSRGCWRGHILDCGMMI